MEPPAPDAEELRPSPPFAEKLHWVKSFVFQQLSVEWHPPARTTDTEEPPELPPSNSFKCFTICAPPEPCPP